MRPQIWSRGPTLKVEPCTRGSLRIIAHPLHSPVVIRIHAQVANHHATLHLSRLRHLVVILSDKERQTRGSARSPPTPPPPLSLCLSCRLPPSLPRSGIPSSSLLSIRGPIPRRPPVRSRKSAHASTHAPCQHVGARHTRRKSAGRREGKGWAGERNRGMGEAYTHARAHTLQADPRAHAQCSPTRMSGAKGPRITSRSGLSGRLRVCACARARACEYASLSHGTAPITERVRSLPDRAAGRPRTRPVGPGPSGTNRR
jgi:hypothetical protein